MRELILNLPLLAFLIFLISYMTRSFFISYHLAKFGIDNKTRAVLIAFLFGLAILLSFNFYFFFKIDWTEFIYDYISFPETI